MTLFKFEDLWSLLIINLLRMKELSYFQKCTLNDELTNKQEFSIVPNEKSLNWLRNIPFKNTLHGSHKQCKKSTYCHEKCSVCTEIRLKLF